ncbi:hypothetical protein Naga_100008g70 [Nannochloropsis gaditana]|uniref:Uncharacterized protein n=1 Tax=Nannochloropsis gaditana TaxID=72520 RepID=W7TX13_9STRA|nr:hypothetical protein Naga_100008g70 [Nannochloropsis gaditana]
MCLKEACRLLLFQSGFVAISRVCVHNPCNLQAQGHQTLAHANLVIVSRGRLIEKFALRKPVLEFQIIYWACKPLNKT